MALQVGAATESVTVTAEASLLKTETGELAHQRLHRPIGRPSSAGHRGGQLRQLRLPQSLRHAADASGHQRLSNRRPFHSNGLGGAFVPTETMRIEGQDSTSRYGFQTYDYTQMAQPSADAIQEIAYQTSNYSPEYGQAGSVVINMTMKSGTNQYHGSGYDYFVNEDLNAGDPFSRSGGCLTGNNNTVCSAGAGTAESTGRATAATISAARWAGPSTSPKSTTGTTRPSSSSTMRSTWRRRLESFADTVPTPAFLKGDFSAISPNGTCSLCSTYNIPTGALGTPTAALDPLGRQYVRERDLRSPLASRSHLGAAGRPGIRQPVPGQHDSADQLQSGLR